MSVNIIIVTVNLLFVVGIHSSMVELISKWKPNVGWEVTCSWNLFANDSLRSVKLFSGDQELMTYSPTLDGSQLNTVVVTPVVDFHPNCYGAVENETNGKCVILIKIYEALRRDYSSSCEVTGEEPYYRSEKKTIKYQALVPPSAAIIKNINIKNEQSTGMVNVNCTSTGIHAPDLIWTIGDEKIPSDLYGGVWNFTTKLHNVWSSLSYTPGDNNSNVTCTPEIVRGGKLMRGTPAHYIAASSAKGYSGPVKLIVVVFFAVVLTR